MFAARTRTWISAQVCIAAGMTAALVAFAACGQATDTPGVSAPTQGALQKVTPLDRVYAIDDLVDAGFRTSREYDVEGLTEATGAWFGWWEPGGGDPVDYEVRFYRSHEDAVEYGTSFAEEASGEDAILNSNDATWKGDVRDRRSIIGGGAGGGARSGAGPKYGDYVIFANTVMLCEGTTPDHSFERCESLIDALRPPQPGGD